MTATERGHYFPAAGDSWERQRPEDAGFDPDALQAAVNFALANETTKGHYDRVDLSLPQNDVVGPLKDKGPMHGLILRNGRIVTDWGNTAQIDMTYSVAKSYLSTMAGLALDDGLIRDVDDLVREYVPTEHFQGDHNGQITWRMLLQQTSEWVGKLFDKNDTADRRKGVDREIQTPGTLYEYNDVRVNLLGFALLHVWRRPLPEVLKERVMDPIGGSDTWQWHGYSTSYVDIDGKRMQSVSGGSHFGGGIWINSLDHARFGHLFLAGGNWNGRQLISEKWIAEATTPSACEPTYGYMWWLNPRRALYPSCPENCFAAHGAGGNYIWISPDHGLVVVVRWLEGEHRDAFFGKVLAALR
ncbi:MAG TPA: serine hydrolase [Thermomicrobiales bacterium]|nr:serine hydrolase [Thermomicrobiales bacterium]